MSKHKIITRSWVHKDGKLVEFKDLPPAERERAALELRLRYLNALYRGKAVFYVPQDGDQTAQTKTEEQKHADNGQQTEDVPARGDV